MATDSITLKVHIETAPKGLDLTTARLAVWALAGLPPSTLGPSIDVLTVALAALAREVEDARQTFAAFQAAFEALAARERLEHKPVAGRITFGRPVRGVVSFTVAHP